MTTTGVTTGVMTGVMTADEMTGVMTAAAAQIAVMIVVIGENMMLTAVIAARLTFVMVTGADQSPRTATAPTATEAPIEALDDATTMTAGLQRRLATHRQPLLATHRRRRLATLLQRQRTLLQHLIPLQAIRHQLQMAELATGHPCNRRRTVCVTGCVVS